MSMPQPLTGRIFDIQRFSIHDGDGIRTLVFFKGCIFRCRWCCNPESQEFAPQILRTGGKEKLVGKDMTVEEVMREVRKDVPYYRRSGGGLTLSGGECLLQPDFCAELLHAAHAEGISTAIESMACVPWTSIDRVLPYLDTYLMDIKHMDPAKHELYTGRRNKLALENARRVAEDGRCTLVIRVPVIPGFNDTEEEIAAIAAFTETLPGVKKLHLLPYHRLGQGKYEGLGRPYLMGDVLPPTKEKMEQLLRCAQQQTKAHCVIGG